MKAVAAIMFNTFKEAVRNRILYVILLFSLIMIGASGAISELSISDHERIIKNLGFTAINLFGVAIAIFVGVSLVYTELEKRTIYTIVSKPIARWQFLTGKYLGLLLTVYVTVLVMTIFFNFMLHYRYSIGGEEGFGVVVFNSIWKAVASIFYWGDGPDGSSFIATSNVMPVIVHTLIELAMVTAIAILFSAFTTPTLSMFFTVMTFIAGRANEDIVLFYQNLAQQAAEENLPLPPLYYVTYWAARVIPNLGVFARSVDDALYRGGVIYWWDAFVYGIGFSAAVLLISVIIFQRRNFK